MDNPALEVGSDESVEKDRPIKSISSSQNGSSQEVLPSTSTSSDDLDRKDGNALFYSINDDPPYYLTVFLGFQHYIMMAGGTVSVPFILCPAMCILEDDPARAQIISTIMFVSGIVTLLQSTFGTRLPIIQGGSFAFIVPALAILNQPEWKCPPTSVISALTPEARTELWQRRMRELQGAIIVASLVEVAIGLFGIVGMLLKFITPMTVAPAIALLGLSLFHAAGMHASANWGIAIFTIVLIVLFSQYLKNVQLSIPFLTVSGKKPSYPVFQVFPVLLTIIIAWALCGILTATNVLKRGDPARTDVKLNVLTNSKWIFLPYPFQWGLPTITAGAVFGILSGVIAGAIESIGDYYACARISGAKAPPKHAINRGIFMEGCGCVLAGIFGTSNGTTSYSENIGAISVTKVGARRVIQSAGALMILFSLIGKFGAAFICIPEPIVGGIFCVVFATVTAVGLSNLHGVDLNSARNIFIIGFSIFFGLVISQWMDANKGAIKLGNESLDQIVNILLSTGMFVAGTLGFFLDNTIPGTPEERGLHVWAAHAKVEDGVDGEETAENRDDSYDIPYLMTFIRKFDFFKYVPISPTFQSVWMPDLPKTLSRMSRSRVSVSVGKDSSSQIANNASNGTKLQIYKANLFPAGNRKFYFYRIFYHVKRYALFFFVYSVLLFKYECFYH